MSSASIPHLPILRRGSPYESLDRLEVAHCQSGLPLASISQANGGLVRRDLARISESFEILQAIPTGKLLEICRKAGELFMNERLPLGSGGETESPADFVERLSATSGLPYTLCRKNMAKIHQVFTEMPSILRGLTRGLDLSILDRGVGAQDGVPISYHPVTRSLGVVLPSNSPGVNSIWMPSIPLRIPVVLKPGREEPWTPWRIIQAFIAAGCPPQAFTYCPTDHEGSNLILNSCGRSLVFGDQSTIAQYSNNPGIQAHGPGWSKILIGEDWIERWPEFLDILAASVTDNGGRSCINTSAILVPRKGREIAQALAQKLSAMKPLPPSDEGACLSAFANPRMAEFIESSIEDGLAAPGADDMTAGYREGPRYLKTDYGHFILPTVIFCESIDHPLANREFLCPYTSVVEIPQAQMIEKMGYSLVVTALSEDSDFIGKLVLSPMVERLNIGPIPTTHVSWDQPHEGNLFEFLYKRRAIQSSRPF
ncbi:MAG: hypothetical protein AMXMBFR75_32090 [Candidatus Hinthialibacteria bacterium]